MAQTEGDRTNPRQTTNRTPINANVPPVPNSLMDILHKDGSFTYDNVTDSLEALRDAIDALPGGGGVDPIYTFTEWSEAQAETPITGASTDVALPAVILPNLTIGTIIRVIAILKYRKIANSDAAANAINGAADVQVRLGAGAWADCIDIIDNTMHTAGNGESPGDVIVGEIDVSGTVTGMNATYNFQFDDIQADAANLNLYDIQMGIKIFYTV